MKKVLFVVDEKKLGGVSIFLEDMFKMMDRNNLKIDLLVLHNNGECFNHLDKDIRIVYGTSFFDVIDYPVKLLIKNKQYFKAIKKVYISFLMKSELIKNKIIKERKKILDSKYDIEIAFKDGFTAIFTAFGDSKVKYHWLHYEYEKINPNGKYPKLFNNILPLFDKIIAVSENVMNKFNKIYHLESKTQVINNIISEKRVIEKSNEKCDIMLNNNVINLVSVGRLHNQKGYDRLIEAVNMLSSDEKSKIKITIYGGGPDENILKELSNKYNLNSIIEFYGQVNNPYKYLKKYDAFILPSFFEAFGLVIVESMILQVPVIACDNDATSLLIKDKYNGRIIDNSVEGIYNGLKNIINNPKVIKKYKENLTNYKYDNKKIINQINSLFNI